MCSNPSKLQVISTLSCQSLGNSTASILLSGNLLGQYEDKPVKLWNLETSTLLSAIPHNENVTAVCLSPKEEFGCFGDKIGRANFMDVNRESLIKTWPCYNQEIKVIEFHPSSDTVAICDGTSIHPSVKLLDRKSGKTNLLATRSSNAIKVVRFAPNGHLLAAGFSDGIVNIWDRRKLSTTDSLLQTIDTNSRLLCDIAFHPTDRSQLAVLGTETSLWNIDRSKKLAHSLPEKRMPKVIYCHPDGKHLISGGSKTLIIYEWKRCRYVASMDIREGHISDIAICSTRQSLVSCSNRDIFVYDINIEHLMQQSIPERKLARGPSRELGATAIASNENQPSEQMNLGAVSLNPFNSICNDEIAPPVFSVDQSSNASHCGRQVSAEDARKCPPEKAIIFGGDMFTNTTTSNVLAERREKLQRLREKWINEGGKAAIKQAIERGEFPILLALFISEPSAYFSNLQLCATIIPPITDLLKSGTDPCKILACKSLCCILEANAEEMARLAKHPLENNKIYEIWSCLSSVRRLARDQRRSNNQTLKLSLRTLEKKLISFE